jgi:hypothetical protein
VSLLMRHSFFLCDSNDELASSSRPSIIETQSVRVCTLTLGTWVLLSAFPFILSLRDLCCTMYACFCEGAIKFRGFWGWVSAGLVSSQPHWSHVFFYIYFNVIDYFNSARDRWVSLLN